MADDRTLSDIAKSMRGHAILAIAIIGFAVIASTVSYWHADRLARSWISNLQQDSGGNALKRDSSVTPLVCALPGAPSDPTAAHRLESQVAAIEGRIAFHREVMVYFYANYFRAIILSSIFGAISGICLFNIANRGWTNTSNYVVTTFVLATVIGAFYFSLISIFREQDNIATNKAPYLQYVALRNRILTYCATGISDNSDDKTAVAYVQRVDSQMATINDIAIVFDSSKVADYSTLLQKATKAEPTGNSGTH